VTFKQNWEKADQQYKITSKIIERMVTLAFSQSKLISHKIVSGGCANLNIKIILEDNEKPYILRIYLRDQDAAYREQQLGNLLRDIIPIPQVYFVGDLEGYRFAVAEFMPGITLRDLLLGGEPCDIEQLMREAGRTLAKIQTIHFSCSGFFGKGLSIQEPLTQASYGIYVNDCLKHPTVIDTLGETTISKIRHLFEAHVALFPDAIQNHLVHGDFDPANLLVNHINGVWEISGVLDWEFAYAASPLQDVALMLRYAHHMPPIYEAAFISSVQSSGITLPEDWRLRIDLLNILNLLSCLVRCSPDQRPNQCTDICSLIEHFLFRTTFNDPNIEWAQNYLVMNRYALNGSPEFIRAMPWSKVTRFSTSEGSIFLKHMTPPFALEPMVIKIISEWDTDTVPRIIAVNNTLRCFLMKDAGLPLRSYQKNSFQAGLFSKALKAYANIQLKAISHVEAFLSIGVPDWRMARLPKLYHQLISEDDFLQSDGLMPVEIKILGTLQGKVSDLCALLSDYKIPETIEHVDFHDNNILVKENHPTIADWGDAVISHPFFSLASCLESAQRNHGIQQTDKRYKALENAYLDNWLVWGNKSQLLDAFQLAQRLRTIQVALNFSRVKKGANLDSPHNFNGYMAASLRDFMKTEV
jgi:aminoglycoside phosphotransferase (APT) family kinase protein